MTFQVPEMSFLFFVNANYYIWGIETARRILFHVRISILVNVRGVQQPNKPNKLNQTNFRRKQK